MDDKERRELNRRDFIRRAAVTGAAATFAAPVIQTVAATPAFATTQGSPAPGGCWHSRSPDKPNGCMETCKARDKICGPPDGVCEDICGPACYLPENACPDEYCDPRCWSCDNAHNPIFICV
jgi:TAT (twin-arginine translocation) pathway signal sequence